MSSDRVVIDVQDLSKRYEIYAIPSDRLKQLVLPPLQRSWSRIAGAFGFGRNRQTSNYFRAFWALSNVSFQLRQGETLGVIGRNGSGKSTLLQILAGTLSPTHGKVQVNGRVAALLELGSGFDPELSGRENVFLNARILGLSQKEIEARYDRIVEFADIDEFIDEPVKTYSSGMFLRLAFAVQAHIDASIVIIDEALAVGDIFFRQKCYARLEQLKSAGAAILLVSHSMPDIEQHCDRALLLDHGVPRFLGTSSEAAKHYYLLHQGASLAIGTDLPDGAGPERPTEGSVRPSPETFIDLSLVSEINNGQARCLGVALHDAVGRPRRSFQQGETASFYSEFVLLEDVGVPIFGVLIKNDRGIIVHGKNSWQYDEPVCASKPHGSKVVCLQEIRLDLAPGEYVFEIGLSAVSRQQWSERSRISHEEMSAMYVNLCLLARVGVFSVGLRQTEGALVLTHHGIADLPGRIRIVVEAMDPA